MFGKHKDRRHTSTQPVTYIPRHGGPQTGSGRYAIGRKLKTSEIQFRGTAPESAGHRSRLRVFWWLDK